MSDEYYIISAILVLVVGSVTTLILVLRSRTIWVLAAILSTMGLFGATTIAMIVLNRTHAL